MSPDEIRESLGRLRKAAERVRKRPARETVEALARVLDAWRDPNSRWRALLERELPPATGFSPATVREGLARALAPLSGDALRELVQRELGSIGALDGGGVERVSGFETTAILLAGALPSPTLLGLLMPLVLRSGVLAKPSLHDPVTARLLACTVGEEDAELGECLEVVPFAGSDVARVEALLEGDCIVATGSDATVASVRDRVRPPRRFVGYGHRLSVAAVGPGARQDATLEEAARGLAIDISLWDQLGCLSPVAVFVVGNPAAADRLAQLLAQALEAVEARWPRGRLDAVAGAAIAHEREEAEFRAAAGRPVRLHCGAAWTVIREEDAASRPAPLHRFVRVHPVAATAELLLALRPLGPHLAGVALCGFEREQSSLTDALERLGASRLCAPGSLQSPPMDWDRDGRGVLAPLARGLAATP